MPEGAPEGTDLFEIIHSLRAMRRLKPDPVPDDLIRQILLAGQAAPSGGNNQRWRFLVLKDPEIKKKVQVYYKKAFDEVVGPRYASSPPPPGSDPGKYSRQHRAVEYLTDHYHEAPVWIVACLEDGPNPTRAVGSSIYPAVQNMLLAARARLPLVCDPADRLSDGALRAGWARAALRGRLSRQLGQALS